MNSVSFSAIFGIISRFEIYTVEIPTASLTATRLSKLLLGLFLLRQENCLKERRLATY